MSNLVTLHKGKDYRHAERGGDYERRLRSLGWNEKTARVIDSVSATAAGQEPLSKQSVSHQSTPTSKDEGKE